uniref:Uncharacterized protein n=1 Tax=Acrobeloides nanus TaxID=290746 RepID=A0A914CE90_9BILA
MGYLIFIHWYRWYVLTAYYIDVTGPLMVLVQKTTVLAFSLHDGKVKKKEELNEIQKREAISNVPPILDYLGYMFQFQTILTGPLCFYTDFQRFISGENLKVGENKTVTPWKPAISKMIFSIFCLIMIIYFGRSIDPTLVADPKYLAMPWYKWAVFFFFCIFMQRVQYYYAWVLADAVCNLSGFGFNGFDKDGEPKWDLVSNVDPYKVEMALSFKETLDAWNCTTMYWLRRVAYDRVPKRWKTFSTYLLSAMWHGLFVGYYMTFLTGALITISARTVRRCVRWRFQNSKSSRFFYDVLTFLATKVALAYATYPFVTIHFNPGFFIYKRVYFFVHILAILSILLLPKILPPPKSDKLDKERNGLKEE